MNDNMRIREDLLASVDSLSDKQLNTKVEEGRWSIMQVLDHLYLMERGIVHTIAVQLSSGETKTTTDKPIHFTSNRSTKVNAPSFVIPSNEFISLDEMKNKLSESRYALHNVVDPVDENLLEQRTYPHPAFGELCLKQWILFIGLHEKRHLAQIEEVKGQLV